MNAEDYFPHGTADYHNPTVSSDVWGGQHSFHEQDNMRNTFLESVNSIRRNSGETASFDIELTQAYQEVIQIRLLAGRIPIANEVFAKGSFYIFVKANNRPLENINLAGKCDDRVSLDGAFAHVLVRDDPTFISELPQYPRVSRFLGQPIDEVSKLKIDFRVLPDDPQTKNWDLMPFLEDDNVILDFEIVARDDVAVGKTSFS